MKEKIVRSRSRILNCAHLYRVVSTRLCFIDMRIINCVICNQNVDTRSQQLQLVHLSELGIT